MMSFCVSQPSISLPHRSVASSNVILPSTTLIHTGSSEAPVIMKAS